MHKSSSMIIFVFLALPFAIIGQSVWNLNFETWDSTKMTPKLWHDTTIVENRSPLFPPQWHYRLDHIPEGKGLARTTDAAEGSYAVAMSGYYSYEVMRIISGGDPINPGWPIDFKPIKLFGDYKAILLGDCDSLRVYVDIFLTKFNPSTKKRDTIGQASTVLKEINAYERFELEIDYNNTFLVPDTVVIVLAKRRFGFDSPPDCLECSHVFFDDLKLSSTASTQDSDGILSSINLFPNPANHKVSIHSICNDCMYNVIFISSTGQEIMRTSISANKNEINIQNLSSGLYFVKIERANSKEYVFKKLLIQ